MPVSIKLELKTVAALMMAATLVTGIFAGEDCRAENTAPEIRVGYEQDFKPYSFTDENGQPAGFGVDLINAVADSMGISIRLSPTTWDAAWNDLVAGKIDALPVVAKMPSRLAKVDFSLPHTETFDAFFVRTGEPLIKDISAAKGKEIVVLRSDAAHHALLERKFEGKIIPADSITEMFSLISSGKHDALLYPKLLGTLKIKEWGLWRVSAGPPIPDYERVFSFAVKKGDAELLEKLNQGLLIIKTNGEYDRIYAKWLSVDEPWRKYRKYLVPGITIALVVVLITGVWLVMLQLLVKKRTRELAEKNEKLRLAGNELEERIEQRTAELSRANSGLQAEITERKRAETALQEGEEKYRTLFDNMIDGFAYHRIVLDGSGKPVDYIFLEVNAAFERLTGLHRDNLVGKNVREVLPGIEHDPADWIAMYGRVALTGREMRFEQYAQRLDKWYLVTAYSPLKEHFATIFEDITARKQTEQALRESEERFRTLTESSPDCIALHDRELRHLYVNPAVSRLTGLPQQAFVGKTVWEIGLPTEAAVQLDSLLRRTLEAGRENLGELTYPAPEGSRFYQWRSVPVLRPDGAAWAVLAIASDITERRKMEESLRENASTLAFVNKELEDFSYAVSNDLRAPLRAIEGFTQAILEDCATTLDDTAKNYFRRVTSASRRMAQLIDALLNMARLTRSELRARTVDLSNIANVIAHELRMKDTGRPVEFIIARNVKARGDGDMLRAVLENLLDNAWKFSSRHASAKIEFGVATVDDRDVFFVRDDGAGFSMEYADNLFMPFKRLHGDSEFPGLGIGLATVKRIIERHGGRVWAEGAVEKGASIYFTLG